MREDEAEVTAVGSLAAAISAAKATALADLATPRAFTAPRPAPRPPSSGNILYQRPVTQIHALQKVLGVSTYREVGERTFDYYLKYEAGEG